MIGTNDISIDLDLGQAPDRLGLLLDRIIENAPDALVVLAQMVPTTDDNLNDRVEAYNDAMPALVTERQETGAHIVLVDMYGAYTANANYKDDYMDDLLHPNDAGYVVMADVWYEAIGELLPAVE
jgi:lysophospholipase L1-like esterase